MFHPRTTLYPDMLQQDLTEGRFNSDIKTFVCLILNFPGGTNLSSRGPELPHQFQLQYINYNGKQFFFCSSARVYQLSFTPLITPMIFHGKSFPVWKESWISEIKALAETSRTASRFIFFTGDVYSICGFVDSNSSRSLSSCTTFL